MKYSNNHSIQKLCTAGFLIAMGILLPQIFHIIGGPTMGGIFLPMHIPVLISGLLLGSFYGTAVGAITPLISFVLTGMPPAAKLPFMFIELAAYGYLSGIFQAKRCNLYLSLILAQFGGRLVNAFTLLIAAYLLRLDVPPVITVFTSFVTGLPGIVIQLIIIPAITIILKRVINLDRGIEAS